MNKEPLVSIIIPCYNKANFISDAIESALKQSYSNIECLIIDDGSTDESRNVANKYVEMDKRIRYYYKENGGPSSSRNYGVQKAKGEWIQFLDADDWLCADKIKNQLSFLNETIVNEDVVFYSDYVIIEESKDGTEKTEKIITLEHMGNQDLIKNIVGRKFGLATPTPLHVNNTLFKRSIFRTELFNESVYYEDLIFFYNLLIKNIKFIHTPCIGMYYRSNKEGISKVNDYVRIGYLQLLETVYSSGEEYLRYSPNVNVLLKYFAKSNNKQMFIRTMSLVRNSNLPVYSMFQKNIRKSLVVLDTLRILYPLIKYQKRLMIKYPKL